MVISARRRFPGFALGHELAGGAHAIIYRAVREADQRPVILKALHETAGTQERSRFTREYELLRALGAPAPGGQAPAAVVEAYELISVQRRPVMVLEDFGVALARLQLGGQLDTGDFLQLALALTEALGSLRQRQVIHRNLTPSHALVHPASGQVKLIGLGDALALEALALETTALAEADSTAPISALADGGATYIAPEQTGRTQWPVDERADLYALGVMFYELLVGAPPFVGESFPELAFSHLARRPVPPHAANAQISRAVSDLVMTLLEKDPHNRYQSTYGLAADLESYRAQWEAREEVAIPLFSQRRAAARFALPARLYGRETALAAILETARRAQAGQVELVLISGPAGVGKSALAQEAQRRLAASPGHCIAGKFEQFGRADPYAPLATAFGALIHHLLMEGGPALTLWRQRLLEAVGANGQLLIELTPQLELIIGPQPPVSTEDLTTRRNRFQYAFCRFVDVFAQAEHPLTLALDDLQWADAASLDLLETLLSSVNGSLLVLATVRDAEGAEGARLRQLLGRLEQSVRAPERITLGELPDAVVTELLMDTLRRPAAEIQPLAELLLRRTQGNPYFLREVLTSLATGGAITFDHARGEWQWDLERIARYEPATTLIEFLLMKAKRLPAETQYTLQIAACVGARFDAQEIVTVSGMAFADARLALWTATAHGLIERARPREEVKTPQATPDDGAFVFAHDKVQQTFYSLLSSSRRTAIHYALSRALLAHDGRGADNNDDRGAEPERVFEIVDHLNRGRARIRTNAARIQAARLNLIAGRKAQQTTAYAAAGAYLAAGIAFLPRDAWERCYALTRDLYCEAAETAYLTMEYEQVARYAEVALQHFATPIEATKIFAAQIQSAIAQNQMGVALEIGLGALKRLGVSTQTHLLTSASLPDLERLPAMTDPEALAATRLLYLLLPATLFYRQKLLPRLTSAMLTLAAQHGVSSEAALGVLVHAAHLCADLNRIDEGSQLGAMATRLYERFANKAQRPRFDLALAGMMRHFLSAGKCAQELFSEVIGTGLDTGDFFSVAMASFRLMLLATLDGAPLATLQEKRKTALQTADALKQEYPRALLEVWGYALDDLSAASATPTGKVSDETRRLNEMRANKMERILYQASFARMTTACLMGDYHTSIDHSMRALRSHPGAGQSYEDFHHAYYATIAYLECYRQGDQQPSYLERAATHRALMEAWARQAPQLFAHKYTLVEAEAAWVAERHAEAGRQFAEAIRGARAAGHLLDLALASELAGMFYLDQGIERVAQVYLGDAYAAYQEWGASAKTRLLAARFPDWLGRSSDESAQVDGQPAPASNSDAQWRTSDVDVHTLLRSAQTLAADIRLPALLANLMRFALENAGAEYGALLMEEQGRWVIEAEGHASGAPVSVLQSLPLDESDHVSGGIVRYVIRARETALLHDAARDGQFAHDQYIQTRGARSVLCMPLITQGTLTSVLYLENNAMTGAFTAERLDIMNWLSAQMAISIENARLYRDLERKVEARTVALQEEIAVRERAEETLRTQERQYRALVEHSPDIIARFDRELRFLYASPAIRTLTRRRPSTLVGARLAELGVSAALYEDWEAALRRVFTTRAPAALDFSVTARGAARFFQARMLPEPASDGAINSALVIVSDTTERKRIEGAMRQATQVAEEARRIAERAQHEEEQRRGEADRRRQIAESLRDILSVLNSNRPLDEALSLIGMQASRTLGAQAVVVCREQKETQDATFQVIHGLISSRTLGAQMLAQATLDRTALAIADLDQETALATGIADGAVEPAPLRIPLIEGHRALLAAPLAGAGGVEGALALYYAEPRVFSAEERQLAVTFSDHVALAIENARLRDQIGRAAVVAERNRIARELHDAVTQSIFAASLIAETLPRLRETRPDAWREGLEELRQLTRGALAEMRTLLLELRPSALLEKSLEELLRQLTGAITSRTRIPIALTLAGESYLAPASHVALYRIAQEALNNTAKHAEATKITVTLRRLPQRVTLRISDNGRGFDLALLESHQGLGTIRERAEEIGAALRITSQPGKGTRIEVTCKAV
jgi:PAS domain S-box-containing protein